MRKRVENVKTVSLSMIKRWVACECRELDVFFFQFQASSTVHDKPVDDGAPRPMRNKDQSPGSRIPKLKTERSLNRERQKRWENPVTTSIRVFYSDGERKKLLSDKSGFCKQEATQNQDMTRLLWCDWSKAALETLTKSAIARRTLFFFIRNDEFVCQPVCESCSGS